MPRNTIKFLADESLERQIVIHLRNQGFDVISIAEKFPSLSDIVILKKAVVLKRIIITNDKDYGDLIFLDRLRHTGIILFRFTLESVHYKIKALDLLLSKYTDKLKTSFIVLEEDKARIRAM